MPERPCPTDPAASERLSVVCIGASAGGLESLQALLPTLPTDLGLCYVVLQHTAPKFRSMLAEILAKHTAMPVRDLCDGDAIAADRGWSRRPMPTSTATAPISV